MAGVRMELSYQSGKIEKLCTSWRDMQRQLGPQMASRLAQRMAELIAVDNLADLGKLPGPRCHELTGPRAGQLSVDLVHPRRLILKPTRMPPPSKPGGGLDWARVDAVTIVEIADTH